MSTTQIRHAPTVQDATAAAKRLMAAYEGLFAVLVHGSVARGEATEDSDIDLVAVFTDLDYTSRRDLRFKIEKRAMGWVPFPVQVHPTDLPEWSTRSTRVPCSFEANVMSGDTAVIANGNTDTSNAVWHKEQKLASENLDASLDYLWSYVAPELESLAESLEPNTRIALIEKDDSRSMWNRMRRICLSSSMTVELSIKTLATLRGESPVTEKEMRKAGHRIDKCLEQLSRPYQIAMTRIVTGEGLNLDAISSWRSLATYPDNLYASGRLAEEQVDGYVLTALSVTSAVISEFKSVISAKDQRLVKTQRRWHLAAETYDTIDPRSGKQRETALDITHELEALNLGVIPGQGWLFDSPEFDDPRHAS